MMIILPDLSLAAFLWTAEARARAEDGGSSETRGSRSHQAPVDRSPEVLCGGPRY
jgi:hypothetical protein